MLCVVSYRGKVVCLLFRMEAIYFGLKCLQYPDSGCPLEITSIDSIIHLICWLEDLKIRELPVNEREPLRKYSENWNQEFQKVRDLDHLIS